jgi:hypothetical protein
VAGLVDNIFRLFFLVIIAVSGEIAGRNGLELRQTRLARRDRSFCVQASGLRVSRRWLFCAGPQVATDSEPLS